MITRKEPLRDEFEVARDFRKLIAWQKAHRLALDTHRAIDRARALAPTHARNQLQRAIASIPANIAEGCGKRSEHEFARYIDIALGSAKECENHLIFAHEMQWMDDAIFERLDAQLTEVRRILLALGRAVRLRASASRGTT
jgi:four helix bundle protein